MKPMRLPLFVLLIAVIATATTIVPASIERLTAQSTHVVLARAMDSRSMWDASHSRIYTITRFQTVRPMKGTIAQTFAVKRLGGHADGYNMKVAGVRSWRAGDEAVLFLQPDSDNTFYVTGLMQGDFRVKYQTSGAASVSNGVRGATQVNTNGTITQYQGSRMSLAELEQRVRKAAGQ